MISALAILAVLAAGDAPARPAGADRAMLGRHLLAEVDRRLDEREREVAVIKTVEAFDRRRAGLKDFLRRSLGDFPDRTPLNARVVGTLRRRGYRLERVIFESRPRHHVTANLYVPDGEGPFPGVLLPCGHSANGKAAEAYQRACILLARSGMVVLCYDPIGQGERAQLLDRRGGPAISAGSTTEHTLIGVGALLVGRQTASYRVWDGIRALDYLAGRPEVDPARLGCTGNSGGGTLTAYLMALDDRIAAAAPSCYITSLRRLFATIGPQDAEQNITGQVAAGLDHADYVTIRAPKPTLISAGTQDFFDIGGSWDTFREAKRAYSALGFGERVDLFESDEPHGFTAPRRVAAARWLRRWLVGIDDAVTEPSPPGDVEPDRELQCTTTGQVLSELGGVSAFDLNIEAAARLAADRRAALALGQAEFRGRVRTLLGLPKPEDGGRPIREIRREPGPGYEIRRLVFGSEPGIELPTLMLVPEWPDDGAPLAIRLGVDWGAELAPGGEALRLVRGGRRVVLADARGLGATAPAVPQRGGGPLLGPDVKEAFLSLHLGRPLLGQRVLDVECLIRTLDRGEGVELHGVGPSGPVVLHAAALDDRGAVRGVTIERSLASWSDVVRSPISRHQLAGAVPGVLRLYDLPDLADRLSPLPLRIASPVDALGDPVPLAGRLPAEGDGPALP